ncbi:hypothetical protein [Ferruginibacter sp.]
MFIKNLYRYSKTAFIAFVLFIVLFIFINYKWGVVATPVYQYGMFSSVFRIKDTQTVYHIYINDTKLDISQYHFAERDMLLISLENYAKAPKNNSTIFFTMKGLLDKTGVGSLMQQSNYFNTVSDTNFTVWYKKLLQQTIGYPVLKTAVFTQKYILEGKSLKPVSSPQKLTFLVAD